MSLLFGQQPTPFNQSGGSGGGDMLKSVYDTNDDGIVDTAAAVSSGPGAGTLFDVTLDANGEVQIPVANADTKKVYGLSFNSQAEFGGTPERFGEGDTDNINIRSTAGPAHSGRSVTGFYLSLLLMLFGATGFLSPTFGQAATSTTFIDMKRQVAPANPGASFDRMWIGGDHQVRFQQPDGTVQFMPYYLSSLSGIPIATSGALIQFAAAPGGGDAAKFLRGDGTWASPTSGFSLQTETTFTNNNTPAIYLKSLTPNTTRFLRFNDNSGASMLSVYSDGAVESASSIYSGSGIFATTGTSITLRTAGSINVGVFREYGSLSFEGANPSTSGLPKAWLDFTGTQNNTGITASTEYNAFWYNPPRTYTWNAGGITNQRFFYLRAPTLAFGGASTVTNAATFTISGAPIAGSNATITNPYALWIASGMSQFDGNVSLGSSNAVLLGGATSPGTNTKLQLGTPTTSNNNVNLYLEPTGTTITPLAIQGNSSQSADLFQAFDSSGNKVFAIAANGIPAAAKGGVGANTAFGLLALNTLTSGNGSTAFGYNSLTALNSGANTAFGYQAGAGLTSGTNNVSIGYNSLQYDQTIGSSVIIGDGAFSQSNGGYTGTGPVLAIGRNAGTDLTTQNNIAVFGSATSPLNDWYFGESYTTASPSDVTFQPSVGSGTNIAGASFYLKGGAGTGNATPGKLHLQYASAGSSGATLQSYTTAITIDSSATDVAGLLITDRLKGGTTAPSAAVGAGAGTGATVSVSGTDLAGEITLTTGTATPDGGVLLTLTFSSAMTSAPFPQITPANTNAADVTGTWYVTSTTTTLVVTCKGVWPESTQIKWNYFNPQ